MTEFIGYFIGAILRVFVLLPIGVCLDILVLLFNVVNRMIYEVENI